jgi:hypothetical protein
MRSTTHSDAELHFETYRARRMTSHPRMTADHRPLFGRRDRRPDRTRGEAHRGRDGAHGRIRRLGPGAGAPGEAGSEVNREVLASNVVNPTEGFSQGAPFGVSGGSSSKVAG